MDLDEFAEAEGYTRGPNVTPALASTFGTAIHNTIMAGRRKGYSWAFIARWLAEEQAIVIQPKNLNDWYVSNYPETR